MTEKPVTFVVATLLTNPLDMNSEEINAFIINTLSNFSLTELSLLMFCTFFK